MPFELNTILALLFLAAGMLLLWKAADYMVNGAVGLASHFGVSPLIIGLTIVAMGTSAPEVAASITAALKGWGDIAVANVYGSNIANLALVGGCCAIIRPLTITLKSLKRELPVMLLVAMLLYPFIRNMYMSRLEGIILIVIFAFLIVFTVLSSKKEAKQRKFEIPQTEAISQSLVKSSVMVFAGIAGLALGAKLAVEGSVFLGNKAGLSHTVIGLTIVAVGTSLPELVTSIVAATKNQNDISLGNLIGSNVFNTLLVTGSACTLKPFSLPYRLISTDYWIMVLVTAMFFLFAIAGKKITKINGFILLATYIAYMGYLLLFTPSV